jgi:predicted Zn-dependent protease
MTREQCEKICRQLLSYAKADEAFVTLTTQDGTPVRFMRSICFEASRISDVTVQLVVRVGKRYASASSNSTTSDALRTLAERAVALAGQLPESETIVPFAEKATLPETPLFSQNNTDIADSWRFETLSAVLESLKENNLVGSGHLTTANSTFSVASSAGLFLHQPSTGIHFLIRVFTKDGLSTGYGENRSRSINNIRASEIAQGAIDRCLAWRDPVETKAVKTRAILHPAALADLFMIFIRNFDQQAINENRSFLRKLDGSSTVGFKVFPAAISMYSDPFDLLIPSMPFSADGVVIPPTRWIRSGVIENVALSRFDAVRMGVSPLPAPTNLRIDGGTLDTLEKMISKTEQAVLVHGFSSLSSVDPASCLLSGTTRDGAFLIEDGKISRAVKNLAFRDSPVAILQRFTDLGKPEIVYPRTLNFPMLIPPVAVADFNFTKQSGVI